MIMNKITEKIRLVVVAALVMIEISSCNPAKKYEEQEEDDIQAYLNENPDLEYVKKESGLYYLEVLAGTGDQVEVHDSIYFDYVLYYLDGFVLADTCFSAKAGEGELIPGVEEAMLYMKDGGICKIIVPSFLGYGNSGYYFPAYTPLLYDLQITKLVHPDAK